MNDLRRGVVGDLRPPSPGSLPISDAPRNGAHPAERLARPGAPSVLVEKKRERFPISDRSEAFRKRFFPEASRWDWNDWRWQLRHRIRDLKGLARFFQLTEDERQAVAKHEGSLPLGITPYLASLMDAGNPSDPMRRTHVPVGAEYLQSAGEADDPLAEDSHSPVPGLVHRYPDRVLFLVTSFCSTYCRYCTRARMVGSTGEYHFSVPQWERALAYLEEHREVRDVLISGGDPLTLVDEKLDFLLGRLRRIKHIEFVRLGTKMPVVTPQRVTRDFARMLRKHYPLFMSLHFTHPDELTPEVSESCARLADAGVPLGSQTVLLAGINDNLESMKRLMHGLLMRRVRPYYIFQCDPISGSAHFRTPVEKGLEIIQGLRGFTTGYANPTFVIDAPGGGGKIPLLPDHVLGRDGDDLVLRNFEGKVFRYPDPNGRLGAGRRLPEEARRRD
ncbi:MAG: KamA family radical SAM protein [Alphaproteobacteria bacterium]|nr:KamA family radical SAM protein [Alphaproteobacteria bacterium]